MTTKANREVLFPVNPNMGITLTRIKYFTRMKPTEFLGSKVDEDPQKFINEVYTIVIIMELFTVEKVSIAQVWFEQWKCERVVDADPLDWEKFKGEFLDRSFSIEMRETKLLELINM
ncbi:hypothetical protein MTR67_001070 [Solanum verrucosum]|uniref:Gag-pol polyprotein n=1 Tax=Solanum verrucosum TaxID=315347 RepID=A0AAF0PPQ9_SOLVR|nr:hypothetical protein MTR67_001070 [Solanum verrucosum]